MTNPYSCDNCLQRENHPGVLTMVRSNPSVNLRRRNDKQRNFSGTDWDLLEIHRDIMRNELRVWLLRSLLSKNLATRDIYYFTLNQARQCTFGTEPDQTTIKAAMNVKIEDIRKALKQGYSRRDKAKENILSNIGDSSNSLKTRTRKVKRALGKERKTTIESYRRKIEHYQNVQNPVVPTTGDPHNKLKKNSRASDNSPTVPPNGLREFGELSIFGKASDLPSLKRAWARSSAILLLN